MAGPSPFQRILLDFYPFGGKWHILIGRGDPLWQKPPASWILPNSRCLHFGDLLFAYAAHLCVGSGLICPVCAIERMGGQSNGEPFDCGSFLPDCVGRPEAPSNT